MIAKNKNAIILAAILIILVLVYFFVIRKPSSDTSTSTSSLEVVSTDTGDTTSTGESTMSDQAVNQLSQSFILDLQGVKSIILNDAIFSDPAFSTLRDSTIILKPDGTEGRPNPFAPIGFENSAAPTSPPTTSSTTNATTNSTTNPIKPKN